MHDGLSNNKNHLPILDYEDEILNEDEFSDNKEEFKEEEYEEYLEGLEAETLELDESVIPTLANQIKGYKLLTVEQEKYYGKLLHSSCKEERERAKEVFILHNMRLVYSIAARYIGFGLSLEDLVQEGSLGLMTATERYNPDICKFSTYAVYWIRQAVQRAVTVQSRTIRVPVYVHERITKLKRIQKDLYAKNIIITEEKLAKEMDLTVQQIRELLYLAQDIVSLNQYLTTDEDNQTELGDFVADSTVLQPEENILRIDMHNQITLALQSLSEKERQVIVMYYGLETNTTHTLETIGAQMGVTRERVRQIKVKALNKLKSPSNRRILGSLNQGIA